MVFLGLPISVVRPLYRNFRGNWRSYRPFFQPWREHPLVGQFLEETRGERLYCDETVYNVYQYARICARLPGEFWECGVYRSAYSWG